MAILTDDRDYTKIETKNNKKINEHSFSCFGFELNMKIPMVKTSDFKNKKELREKLKTSKNPMAMVVKAQLKSHEVKQSDTNKRYVVVKELIRECYKMGYSKQKTHIILNFFDWVIRLPDAYKKQIKSVIKEAEEENKMEYVATWERDWLEEGIIKGETKSSNHSPGEINQVVISKHPRGDATPRRGCPTPHGGAAEGVLNLLSFGSQSSFYIRQRISPT